MALWGARVDGVKPGDSVDVRKRREVDLSTAVHHDRHRLLRVGTPIDVDVADAVGVS
jgi:hypothetical protein